MAKVDKHSVVIYTAITGNYDTLKEPPQHASDGIDCVAFLDGNTPRPDHTAWQVRDIDKEESDPCRTAKRYKILPHEFFPQKEYSLWIDGAVDIQYPFPTEQLAELFLKDADLCVFRHYRRGCIYAEAAECSRRNLDDPAIIDRQIQRYREEGYPENAGLVEAIVLLRRHTPAMQAFNETWWQEIQQGSRRDQISFNYVARKLGLHYNTFPLTIRVNNGLFSKQEHLKNRQLASDS